MKNIDKQIDIFSRKLLRDTFLKKISKESIRNELCASILEGYTQRKKYKLTQNEFSKLKEVSIATVKRIENGTCYDAKLISKYSNTIIK